MSRFKCCVPGCAKSSTAEEVLQRFPNPVKDRDRFNAWIFAIGGEIIGLDNDLIFKQRRVCRSHFEEKFLCRNKRISNNAVPTLHLRGFARVAQERLQALAISESVVIPQTIAPLPVTEAVPPVVCLSHTQPTTSKESSEFSLKERKPLRSLQCSSEPLASTSKEFLTVSQPENKENELCYPLQNVKRDLKRKNTSKPDCDPPSKIRHMKKFRTTSELALSKKLKSMRVKISKLKNKNKKQAAGLKAASKLMTNSTFVNTIEKMPSAGKILTLMQFRENEKKDKGRRFNLDEKIIALSIFKQSPRCYRFLRKLFILPAKQTLVKLLQKADMQPGINEKLFEQLKQVTKNMKTEHKLCLVLFDEMALKANISYNERLDRISGFATNGKNTQMEFADHAQVFMVRGLVKNYKQAISYTFSNAATKGPELANQLKTYISKLMEAGFIVVGTVCDQGTNNRQALKILMQESRAELLRCGKEPKENTFVINGCEVVPMYDPPHLLKCIRNNLLTKNLTYNFDGEVHIASWDHILALHKENPRYRNLKLIKKLTDSHVIQSKIPKMKVKYASQLFSETVGGNMGYLADKGVLPLECKKTANVLLFFDKLFDSLNGSFAKKEESYSKPLLQSVKPNSPHHKFWNIAKKYLKDMKFVNKISGKNECVPTLDNWAWTLDSIQTLVNNVHKKYKINSIWMRHLNQDPIENFFGAIRSHGCRDNNPTPSHFGSAFTTLLINNMSSVHAPGANCENDMATNLHALIVTENVLTEKSCELDEIPNINILELDQKNDPRVMAPLQYVTGYFVRNAKKKIFKSCKVCTKDVVASEPLEYIKYREFADKQWLYSPTQEIIKCMSAIQDVQNILRNILVKNNLREFLKTLILIYVEFNFLSCEEHRAKMIEFLITSSCNFFIYNYCKNINRILNGTADTDDIEDIFQKKAKLYHSKFVKNKNK